MNQNKIYQFKIRPRFTAYVQCTIQDPIVKHVNKFTFFNIQYNFY